MRVICIDEDAWPSGVEAHGGGIISNGNSYEVVDVFFDEGYIWYVVSEDLDNGYWENCFARTSDKCETEMERESITQKQTTHTI